MAARDLPRSTGDKYTIAILDFTDDEAHKQAQHIVDSLRDFVGVSLYRVTKEISVREDGDVAENVRLAREQAAQIADDYNADLVVSGRVVENNKILVIHLTPRVSGFSHLGDYRLTEMLRLPANFSHDLSGVLFCECASVILSQSDTARVGGVETLKSELGRLQKLVDQNRAFQHNERTYLLKAIGIAALTLGDCTCEAIWYFKAMEANSQLVPHGDHSGCSDEEIQWQVYCWLRIAEQLQTRELLDTALYWLRVADARYVTAKPYHHVMAIALTLRLRGMRDEAAGRDKWFSDAVSSYEWLIQHKDTPVVIVNECRHMTLGVERDRALAAEDYARLSELAAAHAALPAPLHWRSALECGLTYAEAGETSDEIDLFESAIDLIDRFMAEKTVRQSLLALGLIRALRIRCSVRLLPARDSIEKLRALDRELEVITDLWEAQPVIMSEVFCRVAEAEIYLRISELEPTELGREKARAVAELAAITAAKMLDFQGQPHLYKKILKQKYEGSAKGRVIGRRPRDLPN
jgi:tetratricopeptide (TPR) repeat protein